MLVGGEDADTPRKLAPVQREPVVLAWSHISCTVDLVRCLTISISKYCFVAK